MNKNIEFFYTKGFDLHPLLPNTKIPSRKNWNNLKKLNNDEVFSLFKDNIPPEHQRNLGFRPGRRSRAVIGGVDYCIVVLDFDIKPIDKHLNGLDRSKFFEEWPGEIEKYKERVAFFEKWTKNLNLNLNTLTGSGGFHSYLFIRADLYEELGLKANQSIYKNNELGIEIELLADGKNCVLPPSIVLLNNHSRKYKLINDSFNFVDDPAHAIINLIMSLLTPQEQLKKLKGEVYQKSEDKVNVTKDNIRKNKKSDFLMSEILEAGKIETARSGNQIVCRCPICKPGERLEKGNHEAVVNAETLHCFACNHTYSRTELIELLNLYDALNIKKWEERPSLKPTELKPQQERSKQLPAPIPVKLQEETEKDIPIKPGKTFYYKDLDGKLLYRRVRMEYSDGSGKAGVPYFTPDGKPGKPEGQPPVFYGLETLQDPKDIDSIALAEGAECVRAVRNALVDTPMPQNTAVLGFDKFRNEWNAIGAEVRAVFAGKNIIVFEDNDDSGRRNTKEAIEALMTDSGIKIKSLTVVSFHDKGDKGFDIANWLSEGGSVASAIGQYGKEIDLTKVQTQTDTANTAPKEQLDTDDIKFITAADLVTLPITISDEKTFGFVIQYPSIVALLGHTSTGKTEFMLEIGDLHQAVDEDHVTILAEYEGNDQEIAWRLRKKGMNGKSFIVEFAPSIDRIKKLVRYFKGKKVLVIVDYLQEFGWDIALQEQEKHPNANANTNIRAYVNRIAIECNRIKNEMKNVCFVFISSISNDSLKTNGGTQVKNPEAILLGAKESGDVQFKMDYAYALLFANNQERNSGANGQWYMGRTDENRQIRRYMRLTNCKPKRIMRPATDRIYSYNAESFRYDLIGQIDDDDTRYVMVGDNKDNEKEVSHDTDTEEEYEETDLQTRAPYFRNR